MDMDRLAGRDAEQINRELIQLTQERGQQLARPCRTCGERMPSTHRYCDACGSPLGRIEEVRHA